MNGGLVALGILLLVGMFLVGNIIITPQQRNQVELASGVCGSFLGKIGGAISSDVAEQCRQAQMISQILSLEPFVYIVGFILLVVGLAIPSKKKEVIREIIKEREPEPRIEVTEKPKIVKEKERPKIEKTVKPWGVIAIIGIISIVIIGAILGSYTSSYIHTSTVGQVAKKCYDVQEPYTVRIPYEYTYNYLVIDAKLERLFNLELGDYSKGTVIISNLEDNGGIFTVTFEFGTAGKTERWSKTVSKYISGHSTETFDAIYDSEIGENVVWSYTVNPPTETRFREEVRYKTVQKCD